MKTHSDKEEKSFEAALKRLEEIVSEMERGELKLDAMLKRFDEGMRLAKFCSGKLEEAEKKIEILVKKEDGSFEAREFLPSGEAAPADEGSQEAPSRGQEDSDKEEEPLF